jgi:hypothetical protein
LAILVTPLAVSAVAGVWAASWPSVWPMLAGAAMLCLISATLGRYFDATEKTSESYVEEKRTYRLRDDLMD